MPNRRIFVAGLAAAGAAARARTVSAQPALREINLGLISPTASMWPTFVAQDLDLYKRYGLNPSFIFVGSVAACAQQLIAGSLDVGEISSTQIVEAVKNGATLRYFLQEVVNPPYSFLAQKQYHRYADLKGKLLMIGGPTDITVIFTEKMLASGGLKMSDVDFTYAGGTADRYAALHSGSIAAAILAPPFSFRAANEGYNLLGRLKDVMPPFPFVGWAATDAYMGAHSDQLIQFSKVQLRATRWLNDPANKAKAIDILIRRANANPDDAAKSYDEYMVSMKAFPNAGETTPQTFSRVMDALAQIKILTPPLPPPTNYYDNRFVLQASAQLAREPK
jgi:NitT/TauT family transport system substrate-binding protein